MTDIYNQSLLVPGSAWYGQPGLVFSSTYIVDASGNTAMIWSGGTAANPLIWASNYIWRPVTDTVPAHQPTAQPLTNQNLIDAINKVATNANAMADAVNLAIARGINPLSYVPATQPNLNPAPWSVTLPDGTVVTVTPKSTLGGQDTISPAPSSTTSAVPAPVTSSTTSTQTPQQTNTDLCALHPNSSACADLGTAPTEPPMGTKTVDVSGTSFNTYSFFGNAACPAPKVFSTHGRAITFSYQPFCDFLNIFRLIALAVATFIAGLIMFGQKTSDSGA